MRTVGMATLSLLLLAGVSATGVAHSLEDVENRLADKEIYFQPVERAAPEFTLEDAGGREIRLDDFRGKVVVLHFIYARCPDVCPLHAERIAEIQRMINQTPMREQVQFVTVTTDPERDTGAVMRDYGAAHGLDPVNWIFLTSGPDEPDATRALAAAFGHKFTETEDGYQMHGVVTHVIDREGELRANFHGLKFDPTNLVVYVNALVNDVHTVGVSKERSFWDSIWDFF